MDGLGRAIGAGVPVEFDGKTLIFEPMNYKDLGVVEQHMLAIQPSVKDLLEEARAQAREFIAMAAEERFKPPGDNVDVERREFVSQNYLAMAEKVMASALAAARKINFISRADVVAWIDSFEGLTFSYWLKFDQRYPGRFSLEKIQEIVQAMGETGFNKLCRVRDQASGFDELGNSTGPTSPQRAETAGPTGG